MALSWGYQTKHPRAILPRVLLHLRRSHTRRPGLRVSRKERIPIGGAVPLNRSPRRIPKTTSETNHGLSRISCLMLFILFKDTWLGSLPLTKTTVDKYPLRSCRARL